MRVGHDADHDRRHAVQHVGGKANGVAEAIAAKLREIDACAHAERNSEKAGEAKNEGRADDGVGHSAARFAHRFRSLRQESPVDRADAAVDQIGEDREQRHQHEDDGQNRHAGHDMVGDTAPQSDRRNACAARHFGRSQALALEGWPRVTVQTSSRASAFTTIVTRNSARPISIKAER